MDVIQYNSFSIEKNKNKKIWRYMDFPKFIDLLHTNRLYFSTPSELESLDPYDGCLPESLYNLLNSLDNFLKEYNNPKFASNAKIYNRFLRELICINCWHVSEEESFAMWNSYSSRNSGIAICTTVSDLVKNIQIKNPSIPFQVGLVDYKFKTVSTVYENFEHDVYLPFFTKRKCFSYESELRIIAPIVELNDIFNHKKILDVIYGDSVAMENNINKFLEMKKEQNTKGMQKIEVDNMKDLIKEIYIAPSSPDYYLDAVKSIVDKYELDSNIVIKSPIMNKPDSNKWV